MDEDAFPNMLGTAAEDAPPTKNATQRPPKTITYQPRPFADLICRASDKQVFHTHNIILGYASPVLLERILALPSDLQKGPPILDIDVPGRLLGAVIELCYPVKYEGLDRLSVYDAAAMTEIAKRLKMDALYDTLRYGALGTTKVSQSLATYLLACRFNLPDIVKDTHGFLHSVILTYGCIPEMEITPALPYHRLLVNRRKSIAIASTMTRSTVAARATPRPDHSITEPSQSAASIAGDPWLLGILDGTMEALRSPEQDVHWWEQPNTSKTLEESVQRKLWCGSCEGKVRLILRIEQVYTDVHKAMDENNVRHQSSSVYHPWSLFSKATTGEIAEERRVRRCEICTIF